MRQREIPRKLDGSGAVTIQAAERVFEALKLDELPYGEHTPVENGPRRKNIYRSPSLMRGRGESYRVLMERPVGWPHKKDPTLSFQLSSAHINETLYLLAEFWRAKRVPFQRITNKNGNGFSSAWLSSYSAAHLTNQ